MSSWSLLLFLSVVIRRRRDGKSVFGSRRLFLLNEFHPALGAVARFVGNDIGIGLHRADVLMCVAVAVVMLGLVAAGHGERGDTKRQRHQRGQYPFCFHRQCFPFGVVVIEL